MEDQNLTYRDVAERTYEHAKQRDPDDEAASRSSSLLIG